MLRELTITTQYDVDPAMACGGILVKNEKGEAFVEVTPGEEYRDEELGYSLWEYAESNGDIRACLMRVDGGRTSPRWHILPHAGEEVEGSDYYEMHSLVSGIGSMTVERCGDILYEAVLPRPIEDRLDAPSLPVAPDSIFHICAENSSTESDPASIYVLATFPGAPFKPEYEKRLD